MARTSVTGATGGIVRRCQQVRRWIVAPMVAALAWTAGAQVPGSPSGPPAANRDIVVRGHVDARPEQRAFVKGITMVGEGGKIARRIEPLCPAVQGLDESYAAIVRARILAVATSVGAPAGKPGCHPNMAVLIATEDKAGSGTVALSSDASAGTTIRWQKSGPVRFLASTAIRNDQGEVLMPASALKKPGVQELRLRQASIMGASTQTELVGTIMLVPPTAIMGKSLTQLADYAAMRSLARVSPPQGPTALPTILSLFDRPDAPKGLTASDAAYLRAIYSGPGNVTFGPRVRAIADAMAGAESDGKAR